MEIQLLFAVKTVWGGMWEKSSEGITFYPQGEQSFFISFITIKN